MKTNKQKIAAVISVLLIFTMIFAGCVKSREKSTDAKIGAVTLSINPEIKIEYDKNGNVTKLVGINDDGKAVVQNLANYENKDCNEVLNQLVKEIYNKGYFEKEIDGNDRNIVLKLEPNSKLPNDRFLEDLENSVSNASNELKLNSKIIEINKDDFDEKYATDKAPSNYISLEKAKEIALAQAGINSSQVKFTEKDFDFEKNVPVYDLEFIANNIKYEYNIDAITGKVVSAEHKNILADNKDDIYDNDDADDKYDDDRYDDDRYDKDDDIEVVPSKKEEKYISKDKAKSIALNRAKLNENNVKFTSVKLDRENGKTVYEIEFTSNGFEYDCDVNAINGKVIDFDKDRIEKYDIDDKYDKDDDDRYDDWKPSIINKNNK